MDNAKYSLGDIVDYLGDAYNVVKVSKDLNLAAASTDYYYDLFNAHRRYNLVPERLLEPHEDDSPAMLSFGEAIEAAKRGEKISRTGWDGKDMFVVLMSGLKLPAYDSQEPGPKVNDRTAKYIGKSTPLDSQPYFAMLTASKQWQPGWLASQADMLAEDWIVVE